MNPPVKVAFGVEPVATTGSAVPTNEPKVARVAVLGASGYSGQEFVRLALGHPGLALSALVSREHAGRPAAEFLPGIDGRAAALPEVVEPQTLSSLLEDDVFDTIVTCLPHGAWRELAHAEPALERNAARVIDLSSDHRDGSASEGGARDGATPYRYGLPEAFRDALRGATRVANPGCYPTAAALALIPAAEAGWLDGPAMVSALSGVSGAGRAPSLRTSFVELDANASLYKAGAEHQHVGEMERVLSIVSGQAIPVGFAPQLAPMARGILLTAWARLAEPIAPEDAHSRYARRYEHEPFVRLLPKGQWPETRAVRSSNRSDVAVTTIHGGRTLLATSALDNLVKGAAGQAIQNLNLMLGWPEDTGLSRHSVPW